MEILLNILGWIAWVLTAYCAASLVYGCRSYAKRGIEFQWGTAIQAFYFCVLTVLFLLSSISKLHLFWLAPLLYISSFLIVFSNIPILGPIVLIMTRLFMRVILIGSKYYKNENK